MKNSRLTALLSLLPVALFAVMLLCSVAAGADGFSRITRRDDTAFTLRSAAGYISTKLASAPNPEAITLERFGETDAIVISQYYGSERYLTRIYCHGGSLCELFTPDIDGFLPEDGQSVVGLDGLELSAEDGLLRLVLQLGEDCRELFFRISGEVMP